MIKQKALVVFYSRTGHTKKVGKEIAEILNADICDIESSRYSGLFGYIKAGYQGVKCKRPSIKYDKSPHDYKMIIIGTPNWGSKMASPVRSFLDGRRFDKVAYFCLQGGRGGEKILDEMERLCGKATAKMIINDRELKDEISTEKIKDFCKKIKPKIK